ncbi:NTP transferase domain-containing protein [Agromyces lapidis]|uniref:NTP transferase domain-containing protein n=1 Tax=Agromyces lapidis TaxID=279574 RepID=A0ABV5SUT3_9MICO|nr:NTP transferase domain-containing protein [Agromyces lapidis]
MSGGARRASIPRAAIVLAGGRAARLGGADKASVEVDGRALLDHVLAAVEGCRQLVVVGPPALARPGVVLVREDPPFGGPVAAIAAALAVLEASADEAWLLACDLPRAARVVELLGDAPLPGGVDGLALVDADARIQWLAGRYRVTALRDAIAALPEVADASMRALLAPLRIATRPDPDGAALDLDTWAAIEHYRSMTDTPEGLDTWVAELAAELGLDEPAVPTALLLDLTREAAHTVTRPAGPLTTYLIGLAVAQGMSPADAAAATRRAIADRAG